MFNSHSGDDDDLYVTVVREGPVGLTAACAFGYHGVQARVFEECTKPKPYSRAKNVWARVQKLPQDIGVRDAWAKTRI